MRRVERWIPVNRTDNLTKKMKRVAKIAQSREVPFNFEISESGAETISDEDYQQMREDALNQLLYQFGVSSMDALDRENPEVMRGIQNYQTNFMGGRRFGFLRTTNRVGRRHGEESALRWSCIMVIWLIVIGKSLVF